MAAPGQGKHWRIRVFGLLFVLAFAVVVGRAWYLQIACRDQWLKRAENQHQKVIPLTPRRGTIYDRNGEELAVSIEVDSIYINPRQIGDASAAARQLAPLVDMREKDLRAKMSSRRSFVWLKRQVSPAESRRVRSLGLAGVHFIKEHKRYYPNGSLGAQVLGFTGLDPHGLEGLELAWDSEILGEGGYLVMARDRKGRGLGTGEGVVSGARNGSSLHLTLDKNIQYIAEKELEAAVRAVKAKAGTVVVLDPETGALLAMANQPDFNPNAFNRYGPANFRNRAITDAFEPGSTLKTFLIATALEQKVVKAKDRIDCEHGRYKVGGKVIHDHHPYGRLSVGEILKHSSNVGAAKIAKKLERERLYRGLRAFGFGQRTGIGLPGEVSGLLRPPEDWFEVDLAAIAFGQGMSATALQLATAMAAVANGGYLMKPYVVEQVVDGYGQVVRSNSPTIVRRVISEATARAVTRMLEMAVEKGGTGTLAAVPGFRVAGKTGTAQKADPVTGGYAVDRYVSSFVGFVPAERPKLVILVLLDEPQGQAYGGLVAAPVFSRIASQALAQLKVAPREPVREKTLRALPKLVRRDLPSVPEATLSTRGGKGPRMPNLVGMSYRQVLQTMERTGLNLRLKGSGRVVDQFPAPGRSIPLDSEIWVRLAQPLAGNI
ncbi:MAG: PASTA domain-containing protein [Deltaproteobacteria bacterium]|nr:MAG: PASTA domain-containing protein [Deltaproteobacteria bacterium]